MARQTGLEPAPCGVVHAVFGSRIDLSGPFVSTALPTELSSHKRGPPQERGRPISCSPPVAAYYLNPDVYHRHRSRRIYVRLTGEGVSPDTAIITGWGSGARTPQPNTILMFMLSPSFLICLFYRLSLVLSLAYSARCAPPSMTVLRFSRASSTASLCSPSSFCFLVVAILRG